MADPFQPDELRALSVTFFRFRDGTTSRQAEGHILSRAMLLQCLDDDQSVVHLLETFEGLMSEARSIAILRDEFARRCGWRDRAHMFDEPELHNELQSPMPDELIARTSAFPWEKLRRFREEAEKLVYEVWGLPRDHAVEQWSWLLSDLQRALVIKLYGMLRGRRILIHFGKPTLTPALKEFRLRTDQKPEQMRRALRKWYVESDAEIAAMRGATIDAKRVVRDVGWFYRSNLKRPQESKRSLAQEYVLAAKEHNRTLEPDQRSTIQVGVRRARQLLSEIPT